MFQNILNGSLIGRHCFLVAISPPQYSHCCSEQPCGIFNARWYRLTCVAFANIAWVNFSGYSWVTYCFLFSISDFLWPLNKFYRPKTNFFSFRVALNFGSGTGNCLYQHMCLHMSQTEKLIKGDGSRKNMACATGTLWKGSCTYWQGDEDEEKRYVTICISFLKWCWKEITNSTGQNSQGNGICLFSLQEESIKYLESCS